MQLLLHGLAHGARAPVSPSSARLRRISEPRLAGAGAWAPLLFFIQRGSHGGGGLLHRDGRCVRPAVVAGMSKKARGSNSWIRAQKFLDVEMAVRDYELDRFGVVNNAVYANYCEHGSHTLIAEITRNADQAALANVSFAISELRLKYVAPLRRQDRFVMKVRVAAVSGVRIIAEHFIYKLPNLEPILEATATAVCLNGSHGPTRVPSELSSKIRQFYSEEEEEKKELVHAIDAL